MEGEELLAHEDFVLSEDKSGSSKLSVSPSISTARVECRTDSESDIAAGEAESHVSFSDPFLPGTQDLTTMRFCPNSGSSSAYTAFSPFHHRT